MFLSAETVLCTEPFWCVKITTYFCGFSLISIFDEVWIEDPIASDLCISFEMREHGEVNTTNTNKQLVLKCVLISLFCWINWSVSSFEHCMKKICTISMKNIQHHCVYSVDQKRLNGSIGRVKRTFRKEIEMEAKSVLNTLILI